MDALHFCRRAACITMLLWIPRFKFYVYIVMKERARVYRIRARVEEEVAERKRDGVAKGPGNRFFKPCRRLQVSLLSL